MLPGNYFFELIVVRRKHLAKRLTLPSLKAIDAFTLVTPFITLKSHAHFITAKLFMTTPFSRTITAQKQATLENALVTRRKNAV